MKKFIIQTISLAVFYTFLLDCSFSQAEYSKHDCVEELASFVGTPGITSSGSTPNSTKHRGPAFSSLTLSFTEPNLSDEVNVEAEELKRKINSFDITPGSAYWLGKKLLKFKQDNNNNNSCAIDLIGLLHNRAAAPLKAYFRDKNGQLDKDSYNKFLENSLPKIYDQSQETPLIKPDIKGLKALQKNSDNKSGRRSIFENY